MPTAKKEATVEELAERISRCSIAISTDYRGLTVKDLQPLRRRMREVGAEVKVIKNTLFRIAAERQGHPDMARLTEGTTAIVFGYNDVAAPVKALTEYIRANRLNVAVRGAYTEGQYLPAQEVADLANLPPREVLIGQVLGALQSPLATLMALLNSTLQQLYGLVEARAAQLEGGSAAEAS